MSRMKLILTQEVGGLGAPGDVVDVAAGYGRNYLLPRGFAISWTRGGEEQGDLIKTARAGQRTSPMRCAPPGDRRSTAGRSSYPTRSRPPARTQFRSGCTPR